jgi:uncharacterized protein (TIGR00661 family)
MKILYAIQGTGNGHLSRARDIIPILQQKGELDILISGNQADIELLYPVKYRFAGMGFTFGKKGGVDFLQTYKELHFKTLRNEISKLPVEDYDIVISDFEPVSSWACFLKHKPCIALSHQSAVLSKWSPKPAKKDFFAQSFMKYYAPSTAQYSFHFERFSDTMFTPVIRQEVRQLEITDKGHYTVYLPSYDDDRLLKNLKAFKDVKWEVFSKHNTVAIMDKNVSIMPINNKVFINSMASSTGVLCGAGFETPAEALFLGKKLLVIPMKHQYEQHCNAAALDYMGIPVMKSLKEKHHHKIESWIEKGTPIAVNYPDITENIIDAILRKHYIPGLSESQVYQKPRFQIAG